MNKIIFANNPLDRMSGFRSDKDWQKANLLDNETRFVVFHSGKPLIHVSSEPGQVHCSRVSMVSLSEKQQNVFHCPINLLFASLYRF